MSRDTDAETVQAAAELIFTELGPYHMEEVYRNALRAALKDLQTESVAFFFGGELVGTQHLDLVWRRYVVEVECLAHANALGGRWQHDNCFMRARTCRKNVLLVKIAPSGARVQRYGVPAPDTEDGP